MTDERRARQMVQYHIEGEHVFPEPECPSCRLDEALRRAALLAGARRWQPTASEPRYWEAVAGWAEAIRALRSHGAEVEDRGWHIRECVLAVDWSHYQIESPCSCEIERNATATFITTMLGGDHEQH